MQPLCERRCRLLRPTILADVNRIQPHPVTGIPEHAREVLRALLALGGYRRVGDRARVLFGRAYQ